MEGMRRSRSRHKPDTQQQKLLAEHFLEKETDPEGFDIKNFSKKGRGIVTLVRRKKGDFLLPYAGEKISDEEGERREEQIPSVFRFFYFSQQKKYCIDATEETGRLGRLVNHGTNRQINAKMTVVEHGTPATCGLALFALRNIEEGEEILYDYGVNDLPWERQSVVSGKKKVTVLVVFLSPAATRNRRLCNKGHLFGRGKSGPAVLFTGVHLDKVKATADSFLELANGRYAADVEDATHIICEGDEKNYTNGITIKIMRALLKKKKIYNLAWLTESVKEGRVLNENTFKIAGDPSVGQWPEHRDEMTQTFTCEVIGELEGISQDDLLNLIKNMGGRMTRPLRTIPLHVKLADGRLPRTFEDDDVADKQWLIDSVIYGSLRSTKDYIIKKSMDQHENDEMEDSESEEQDEGYQQDSDAHSFQVMPRDNPNSSSTSDPKEEESPSPNPTVHPDSSRDSRSDRSNTQPKEDGTKQKKLKQSELRNLRRRQRRHHSDSSEMPDLSEDSDLSEVMPRDNPNSSSTSDPKEEESPSPNPTVHPDSSRDSRSDRSNTQPKEDGTKQKKLKQSELRNLRRRQRRHHSDSSEMPDLSEDSDLSEEQDEGYQQDSDAHSFQEQDESFEQDSEDHSFQDQDESYEMEDSESEDDSSKEDLSSELDADSEKQETDNNEDITERTSAPQKSVRIPISANTKKKHVCLYCEQSFSKLARHLEQMHSNEPRVAKILNLKKKSTERRRAWGQLLSEGAFQHNYDVLNKKDGEIQLKYRPREGQTKVKEDYLPCQFCKSFVAKKYLRKHFKTCSLYCESLDDRRGYESARQLLPNVKTSQFEINIMRRMRADQAAETVDQDSLIQRYGQRMYEKCGTENHTFQYIISKMKELAKLVIAAKASSKNSKLEDLIDPRQFDIVISLVRSVAGFDPATSTYEIPSLALKLGYSLKKVAQIVRNDGIKEENPKKTEKAKQFLDLYEDEWAHRVSCHAQRTMETAKYNRPQLLPFAADVAKLHTYLSRSTSEIADSGKVSSRYMEFAKLCLCQIILFNRRRSGEAQRVKLQEFTEGLKPESSAMDENAKCSLSPFEKKLCETHKRIETRGKKGRKVSLIITEDMERNLKMLVDARNDNNVTSDFIFGRPRSIFPIRGSDTLREFAITSGAKHPLRLTSTKLRMQLATTAQVLGLKYHSKGLLAKFMGHDISVHHDFYQHHESTLELAKITKVLHAINTGKIADHAGKDFDDINLDITDTLEVEDKESDDSDAEAETLMAETSLAPSRPKKRRSTSSPWTQKEKQAIDAHFQGAIRKRKIPGKVECENAMTKERALKNRSWVQVKNFVRNKIAKIDKVLKQ